MLIIPAINCANFNCVREKFKKAAEFSKWIQLDIADGKLTRHRTWNKPAQLAELRIKNYELRKLNLEVHLMMEKPEKIIDKWFRAGTKRVIVHLEALKISNLKSQISKLQIKIKNCEIGLAINPETPVEELIPYLSVRRKAFRVQRRVFAQVLAVKPGLAGQKFQPKVLEKIKFLKKNFPNVMIEVDGGINLRTAKLCKKAGADILATASYIWDSADPTRSYKKLAKI